MSLLGEPAAVEDESEDGGEAIWVMADMALRLEDMPVMLLMLDILGILVMPILIPIDMLGTELNMLLGDSTVIIYLINRCVDNGFLFSF